MSGGAACSACGAQELFERGDVVASAGLEGLLVAPGMAGVQLRVRACRACGRLELFIHEWERARIGSGPGWRKIP